MVSSTRNKSCSDRLSDICFYEERQLKTGSESTIISFSLTTYRSSAKDIDEFHPSKPQPIIQENIEKASKWSLFSKDPIREEDVQIERT
mmetsp:Transcript_16948/g.24610  ORF Transcript_16948/g.24610 Transcript_16948/m.24610 type:complete len:89 (-) Transcript_16948:1061-1327(-)